VRLATACAPAADRVLAAEVGPLREIRLAQDHRAGLAQALHHGGITRRRDTHQRGRAGAGVHAVGGGDVVLHQHGNAVQRAAQAAGGAFGVQLRGDGHRIRIHFQHAGQAGPGLIDAGDACGVGLGQRHGRGAAFGHGAGKLRRTGFKPFEAAVGAGRCGSSSRFRPASAVDGRCRAGLQEVASFHASWL
jgi:hypothetical protein